MHRYEVGKLYHADRKIWPECAQLHWMDGELELVLFLNGPSRHEVEAVRRGRSEFALYDRDGLVVMLYHFDGQRTTIPWSDASYQWHLVPPDRRVPPPEPLTPETRVKLFVTLVNAQSGLIEAMRVLSLSPGLTRSIFDAIRRQADIAWTGREAYDRSIAALYRKYPDSAAMLVDSIARSAGGT
jgi:hypothetical protein